MTPLNESFICLYFILHFFKGKVYENLCKSDSTFQICFVQPLNKRFKCEEELWVSFQAWVSHCGVSVADANVQLDETGTLHSSSRKRIWRETQQGVWSSV